MYTEQQQQIQLIGYITHLTTDNAVYLKTKKLYNKLDNNLDQGLLWLLLYIDTSN